MRDLNDDISSLKSYFLNIRRVDSLFSKFVLRKIRYTHSYCLKCDKASMLRISSHFNKLLKRFIRKPSFLFIYFILLNLLSGTVYSTPHFSFNAQVIKAYTSTINLRLEEASFYIHGIKQGDPDNLASDFIEDDIDFLKIYLSEDKSLFKLLAKNEDLRLDRLNKEMTLKSPYTLYVKAEILLHWGLINLKFGNYLSAFTRIKKAYRLLNNNQKAYPQFSPNLKSLGVIHGMLSAVPNEVKWILKTMGGMDGDIEMAKLELKQVLAYTDKDFIFKNEALVMYGLLISTFDNDPALARQLIFNSDLDPASSPLITFIFANLAMKTNDNDLAIQYLRDSPVSPAYFRFAYLDFMLGITKLRRLDPDAGIFFNRFIQEFNGIHFIKECYQKMAWTSLINNNDAGYLQNMQEVKTKGASVMDEDKQALREAERQVVPDIILLKARLLSDGGYLERAEEMIKSHEYILEDKDHALESNYRLGRIYHLQKKYDQAIAFYIQAVDKGIDSPLHYACASSLYIGTIYEALKDVEKAKLYYQKCLQITAGDYSAGLHQKAKAGLNRLDK
ncbi:MAG: tetratricopeptide repeat protein [Saprospiraceae bacterium]